jgi:hypothetical protein
MDLVIIESPYAGGTEANVEYARRAMHHSLGLGEAPYASHLLYTQPGVLDDDIENERTLGIEAGLAWGDKADRVAVYADLGISPGMQLGIDRAKQRGTDIAYRYINTPAEELPDVAEETPVG